MNEEMNYNTNEYYEETESESIGSTSGKYSSMEELLSAVDKKILEYQKYNDVDDDEETDFNFDDDDDDDDDESDQIEDIDDTDLDKSEIDDLNSLF